jgi:alkylation response protein AidB-like acyl-CoA dehydrogenase
MDLNLSLEQRMLRDSVVSFSRDYLTNRRKTSRAAPDGFSRALWREIVELGWLGVGLPEELGGFGGSPVETMVIHEGIGAGLVVEPLLSTTLAARLIGAVGSSAQRDRLLPPILSGHRFAVVALYENAGRGDPFEIATTATPVDGGWVLRGCKEVVPDAPSADDIIISARLDGSRELALFAIDAGRVRDRLICCDTIDGLRAADIQLDGVRVSGADRLEATAHVDAALAEAIDHAIIANCAEAVGAMDAAVAMTADYLNARQQFGVPIGTFQALQHKLADMVVAVELARSILCYGVCALSDPDPIARACGVSAAKVRVIESATVVGAHAIQLHGGIGVTEEYLISHYFRKLSMLSRRLGGIDYHVARFGAKG